MKEKNTPENIQSFILRDEDSEELVSRIKDVQDFIAAVAALSSEDRAVADRLKLAEEAKAMLALLRQRLMEIVQLAIVTYVDNGAMFLNDSSMLNNFRAGMDGFSLSDDQEVYLRAFLEIVVANYLVRNYLDMLRDAHSKISDACNNINEDQGFSVRRQDALDAVARAGRHRSGAEEAVRDAQEKLNLVPSNLRGDLPVLREIEFVYAPEDTDVPLSYNVCPASGAIVVNADYEQRLSEAREIVEMAWAEIRDFGIALGRAQLAAEATCTPEGEDAAMRERFNWFSPVSLGRWSYVEETLNHADQATLGLPATAFAPLGIPTESYISNILIPAVPECESSDGAISETWQFSSGWDDARPTQTLDELTDAIKEAIGIAYTRIVDSLRTPDRPISEIDAIHNMDVIFQLYTDEYGYGHIQAVTIHLVGDNDRERGFGAMHELAAAAISRSVTAPPNVSVYSIRLRITFSDDGNVNVIPINGQ